MKIDILFLNNEMNGHDEYFDNDLFQEYCETHSFEGKIARGTALRSRGRSRRVRY